MVHKKAVRVRGFIQEPAPRELALYQLDAFTAQAFSGNPAAVVPNARGGYDIRWFSPLTEINFCGHATLASAWVLFNQPDAPPAVTFWATRLNHPRLCALQGGLRKGELDCEVAGETVYIAGNAVLYLKGWITV